MKTPASPFGGYNTDSKAYTYDAFNSMGEKEFATVNLGWQYLNRKFKMIKWAAE